MQRSDGPYLSQPPGLLQKQSSTLGHAGGDQFLARPAGPFMARR
jgi:hypothetical protein